MNPYRSVDLRMTQDTHAVPGVPRVAVARADGCHVICNHPGSMKLGKRWVENIPPSDDPDAWVPAVSEIPSGSSCKYRLDKTTGQLELARALPREVAYPTNYGFIPHTRCSADDEETDVLVVSGEPLVAAVVDDPSVERVHDIADLDGKLREQIETFVRTYKQNQDVQVTFTGW